MSLINFDIIKQNKKIFVLLLVLVLALAINALINAPSAPKGPSPAIAPSLPPQGSPDTSEETKKINEDFYPLAPYSPPESAHFYFLYTGKLQLKVFLIGNKATAKKEFADFAKSKGVDLTTHQITYVSPP